MQPPSVSSLRLGAILSLPGIAIALGVLAIIILGGRELQQRPSFCANCHGASYDDWQDSGTASNHPVCIECHTGAGVVEALVSEVRGGLRIASFFAGTDPSGAKAQVPRENCQKCHAERSEVSAGHHRRIPPQTRLDSCGRCHGSSSGAVGTPSSEIKSCTSCHSHSGGGSFRGSTEKP